MGSKSKQLRSGYTTGACAAAAAKAATMLAVRSAPDKDIRGQAACGVRSENEIKTVEIPFPDGNRVTFKVQSSKFNVDGEEVVAMASVVKDAGDDPDITNGAEIRAEVRSATDKDIRGQAACGVRSGNEIIIKGGKGVGVVTKPGLAIPVGEAAINPVPRRMIHDAVIEAVRECRSTIPHSALRTPHLEVTISVPNGEELAKKTLNHRLGIVGGISILGTTGIVKPLSDDAWTATIVSSLDVAKALGREEVVLSTGRTSEKAHQKAITLPEDCYAMMGDHTEFSLKAARDHGFRKVHLAAQWAKMIKIAMGTPQTHVQHGALEAEAARDFLVELGLDISRDRMFNTTREIYDFVNSALRTPHSALVSVCGAAKRYAESVTGGIPVIMHLVSYEGEIIASSE